MGVAYVCGETHTLQSPPRVSSCLLLLVRLHKEPHQQHSNQDNHEVEENFLCGSLHFSGVIGGGSRGQQVEEKTSVTCLGARTSGHGLS